MAALIAKSAAGDFRRQARPLHHLKRAPLTEEGEVGFAFAAEDCEVDFDAGDVPALGRGPCLGLDLLGGEHSRGMPPWPAPAESAPVAGDLLDRLDRPRSLISTATQFSSPRPHMGQPVRCR